MWVGEDLVVSVQRNAVTPVGFEIYDEVAKAVVDLSGLTITCKVAASAGTTPIVTMSILNFLPLVGAFDVTFDGRTLSTSFSDGASEKRTLAFEIIATDSNGPVVIARGPIYLYPGVSA